MKVKLPNTKMNQIQLDVKGKTKQQLVIQAPNWYLSTMLSYSVDKDKGKAQFDS